MLCCDEKSQCQALERTQPGFPVMRGIQPHPDTRLQTAWHGHAIRRMSYLDGKVFSQTAARHTHRQWLAFLKQPGATPDLTLHAENLPPTNSRQGEIVDPPQRRQKAHS